MLAKTAKLAFAELSSNYSNYRTTTGELQENGGEKSLLSLLTTATTGEWPKEVIEEIVRMFCYIESCENPQDISYSGYVSKKHSPVVPVVTSVGRPDGDKSPVVLPSLPCSFEGDPVVTTIEADLLRAEEELRKKEVDQQDAAREQHFKDAVGKPAVVCANTKLKSIYVSKGAALEYASSSLNLHHGCSHNCLYCYAKQHDPNHYHEKCEVRVGKSSLTNIESDLKNWQGERKPIHLTFQGDPYDLGRQDNSIVREVLQLFRKYDHPFQVLTKGGMKAVQDFDLYGPNDRFGCTLTFINDVDSLKWEPGAALPADRIEALRQAHSRGIETWVSLEPVIDPAQTLALIEATHEFVDHYGVGKWNHDPRAAEIDWPKFRADAEALLNRYGKSYMIKDDLRKAAPDQIEEPAPVDSAEQIRVAALMEFGHRGEVDPAVMAGKLHLSVAEVTAWLETNYERQEKPGGVVRYTQHRAEEAGRAKA